MVGELVVAASRDGVVRCETYLSDIGTYLSYLGEESNTGHPLLLAQSRLSCEVVGVLDESFEDVP